MAADLRQLIMAGHGSAVHIGLPPEQFAAAFPFHLALNRELKLVQTGRTLQKICPDTTSGTAVEGVFRVIRPDGDWSFEWLLENERELFLLAHIASGLQLRGQFMVLPDEALLLFLGSPWLTDSSETAERGLGIEDFAIHDPVGDLLHVLQAHKLALADAKKLLAKITGQRSELSAANERLRQKEAEASKLALIAARTDNAVVLTDADGFTVWVNEGFTRLTGYTLDEMLGKKPGSVLQGPGTDPETVRHIGQQLRDGQGFSVEILNYRKGGGTYWLAVEVQPIHDNLGRLTNFMAIEADITERRRVASELLSAKELAEAASLAKSEFLATISHELRTPLTSIRGFLQTLLSDKEMPPEAREEFLTLSHDQSLRLSRLVDDLLDLSSIESRKSSFNEELLDLGQLARNCLAEMAPLARSKSQRIEARLAGFLPAFVGDAVRLQSVFTNLLSNAVKFTPDRGTVSLDLHSRNNEFCLEVRDNGPGIPVGERERIFEKFHRLYRRGASQAGTGLGLPIVKAIVQHYRGRVEVESEEGRGSCFRVLLPLNAPAATPDDPVSVAKPGASPVDVSGSVGTSKCPLDETG